MYPDRTLVPLKIEPPNWRMTVKTFVRCHVKTNPQRPDSWFVIR